MSYDTTLISQFWSMLTSNMSAILRTAILLAVSCCPVVVNTQRFPTRAPNPARDRVKTTTVDPFWPERRPVPKPISATVDLDTGDVDVKELIFPLPTLAPGPEPPGWESMGPESLILLRRISDRLATMEAAETQRSRKLDTIEYRINKLDILMQERATTLDKVETQITRKMETLEWEMNKISTLLEVIREEVEKLNKAQVDMRVDISKLDITSLLALRPLSQSPPVKVADPSFTDFSLGFSDSGAKLQMIVTNLHSLRRMTDALQQRVTFIQTNVTELNNATRSLLRNQNQTISKGFFYSVMKDYHNEVKLPTISLQTCPKKAATPDDQPALPKDCAEVLERGFKKDGVYQIQPANSDTHFFAYCDMKTEGGGWTVIQRRMDGSINFLREWRDYKHGFGNLMTEHWLGNEKIHLLTNQEVYSIRFELADFADQSAYASYTAFALGSEAEGYMIKLLGKYDGDAGDSFNYHASMKFSTPDMDNDPWEGGNCAEIHTGGWWYNGCSTSNLNGQYLGGEVMADQESQGTYWYEWHGPTYSLQKTEIKIRPANIGGRKRNIG